MQSLKGLSRRHKAGHLATSKDISRATRQVRMHINKYSRGSVLIIAGSDKYVGAMKLAATAAHEALAALRTQSGYVTIAGPRRIANAAAGLSSVFVIRELKGSVKNKLSIIKGIRHDALIFGPGLEPSNINIGLLKGLSKMESSSGRFMVVDGAVIRAFGTHKELISEYMVFTPHDGEFKALTGVDLKGKMSQTRRDAAKSFARKYRCIMVLKGHETIITDGKRVKVNAAKSTALATMGTGDVLAGIIASYIASNKKPFESAVAAVYAHSMIGDRLYKRMGEHITAQDVVDAIPGVLKRFDKRSK